CSDFSDYLSAPQSSQNYPKLDTYKIHCNAGGRSDYATVVQDSAVKSIPRSEYVRPLEHFLITSKMECRFGSFHNGIDLAGITGASIFAIADGMVTFSGKRRLTGNTVVIFHRLTGIESTYGHAATNLVKRGEAVSAGQRIQLLGNTGKSTGPHLHLSTAYQGSFVNPCALLDCRL
ncbi:MAG: hypothetical protein RJB13_1140, partial [Pseudomonadota bacterium]